MDGLIMTDKLLRNITEQIWREAKSQAALEGKSMKDWVEEVIADKLGKRNLLKERKDMRRKHDERRTDGTDKGMPQDTGARGKNSRGGRNKRSAARK
jgi:hypothetical protein